MAPRSDTCNTEKLKLKNAFQAVPIGFVKNKVSARIGVTLEFRGTININNNNCVYKILLYNKVINNSLIIMRYRNLKKNTDY